jgi:hypothetical protein
MFRVEKLGILVTGSKPAVDLVAQLLNALGADAE